MDVYILNCLSKSKCHFTQHSLHRYGIYHLLSLTQRCSLKNKVAKQLIRGKRSARFHPSFSIHHVTLLRDKAKV